MYRDGLQDDEDLRLEIFHLKKQLSNISAENHLLKVKIRKLQNEIIKKDKEMDVVLDPRKSPDVRKILYERSASFVLNMKEKNDELLDLLQEKDVIIRRLQKQADVTKLYSQSSRRMICKCFDHDLDPKTRQLQHKSNYLKSESYTSTDNPKIRKPKNLSYMPGLQEAETTLIEEESENEEQASNKLKSHSSYDIKDQYRSLSRDHLLSIIENLKNNQRYSPTSHQSSRKSSPESDLERIELLCDSPHEEIQQLHAHFLDMLTEVDYLKSTITELQDSQEKTENVLRKKNTNINKLAQEIKNIKRPKPKIGKNRKSCNSADVITRLYSAGAGKTSKCEKERRNKNYEKSNKKVNRERSKKDAVVQVNKVDEECANQCIYVEKKSITITHKGTDDKEYDYEDEVFDECDEKAD